jgi:hypothetical protein
VQAARHEEFLVANLDCQDYINVVYGGSIDNMADYFSKYDDESLQIRTSRNAKEEKNTMPISKKTLRQPDMLLGIVLRPLRRHVVASKFSSVTLPLLNWEIS